MGYKEIIFSCKIMLKAIWNAKGPLKTWLDIITAVPIQYVTGDCVFQRRDDAHDRTFGTRCYHFMTKPYKICDVTSWGSHSGLLERAIINVQTLDDRTNLSVWLKYDLNINKMVSSRFNFIFCIFFIVKNDHSTFFIGSIKFCFDQIYSI